ncbi:hypothetical protein L915_10279, partial [Phytophthora nicotianae]
FINLLKTGSTSKMRVIQFLLSATIVLLASSNDIAATTNHDAVAKSKLSAEIPDDIFVKSVPFIYGNITGKMVIIIDKDSLHEVSTAASSSSDVFNFTELDKPDSASGD